MPDPTRPNILLISSDQQQPDMLGCLNPLLKTPALDRIVSEGVRFDRAYCPNPTCTPTRASILTGQYPSTHGAWALGTKLREDATTVAGLLAKSGYDTSLIGKAHFQPLKSTPEFPSIECQPTLRDLDFWKTFHGPWYGFDHVETARMHAHESHVGGHYALWLEDHGLSNWREYFRSYPDDPNDKYSLHYNSGKCVWDLPEKLHHSCWVAERTNERIRAAAKSDQPFFLWSSFFDPHPPYVVPEPWASMYDPSALPVPPGPLPGEFAKMPPFFVLTQTRNPDFSAWHDEPGAKMVHGMESHLHDTTELSKSRAVYYGMTSLMDREIGRILDTLDELGIADNTLLVFTSDHGHLIGEHGLIGKGPFAYEEAVRVPFLVRWPGHVLAGKSSSAIQSLVDLAPSFLRAAGEPVPGEMQGVDQTPVWVGEAESSRKHALVENRFNPTKFHARTLVTPSHKLTIYRGEGYGELFDLEADPHETNNLWDEPTAGPLKTQLLLELAQATLEAEPTPMPRITHA